jgi:DNA polymerase III sliding clamp (beta) subunit (PCNA family)
MMAVPRLLVLPPVRSTTDGDLRVGVALPREAIQRLLDSTGFAAIKNWNQYVSGTLLETGNGLIRMVTSNGNIMAVAEASLPEDVNQEPFTVVLPTNALDRLKGLLKDATQDVVMLEERSTGVTGRCGVRSFVTGAASGAFPKYQGFLPKETQHRLDADASACLDAIRRAALATSDKEAALSLTMSKDGLRVVTEATDEVLPAFCNSDGVEICVNGRYLADALNACPTERVEFKANTARQPLVVGPVGGELSWTTVISSITKH